jgi:hypothetical protein
MDIKNISFIGNDERIKLNPSILKLKDYYIISYRISAINDKNFRYNFNLDNKDGVKFNDIYNRNISNPDKVKKTPFEYVSELPKRDVKMGNKGNVSLETAVEHTADIYLNNFNDIDEKVAEIKQIANELLIPGKSKMVSEPFISPEFVPKNVFQDKSCSVIPNKQITEGFTRIILCDLNYVPIPGYKLDIFGLDARLFNDCNDELNIDKFYVYTVYLNQSTGPLNFIYEITLTDLGFIITNITLIYDKFVKNIVLIKNNDKFTGIDLHTGYISNLPVYEPDKENKFMHINDILLYNYITCNNFTYISINFYFELKKIKNNNEEYNEIDVDKIYGDNLYKIYKDTNVNLTEIDKLLINIINTKTDGIESSSSSFIYSSIRNMFGSSALTCVKNKHGVNEYFALGHAKIIPTNVKKHKRFGGIESIYESTSEIPHNICENINPQNKSCTSNIPLNGYANYIQFITDKMFDLPENYDYYINKINSIKHFYDIVTENIEEETKINSFFMYIRDKLFINRHMVVPIMYYNFILKFDDKFNIIDITNPFIFTSCGVTGVNFACGLIIENGNFVIPFAVDDSISYIAHIPMDNINIKFYGNIESFNKLDMQFVDNNGMLNISDIIGILPNISDEEKIIVKTIHKVFIEKKIQHIINSESHEFLLIAKYIYKLTQEIEPNNPYKSYISPLEDVFKHFLIKEPTISILERTDLALQKYLKYKTKYLKLKNKINYILFK